MRSHSADRNEFSYYSSLPLYWIGLNLMGVMGIGAAISISSFLQVFVLYVVWNRKSGNSGADGVYRFYGRIILLTVPLGLVLYGCHRGLLHALNNTTFTGSITILLSVGTLFVILIAILTRVFRIEEARVLEQKIVSRFKKNR